MILMDRLRGRQQAAGGVQQPQQRAAPPSGTGGGSNPFNIDFSQIQIPQNLLGNFFFFYFKDQCLLSI